MRDNTTSGIWVDRLRVVRRRWRWIACAVVITCAAAIATTLQTPDTFEASARVLILRSDIAAAVADTPGAATPTQDFNRVIQTQVDVADSPVVRRRTIASLGLPDSDEELSDQVNIAVKPNADVLTVTASYGDAERTVAIVNEYADQFTRYRRELDTAAISRAREVLQERLTELRQDGGGTGLRLDRPSQ